MVKVRTLLKEMSIEPYAFTLKNILEYEDS